MKISEVIILAGGLGTRLRETVPDLPKCLAPVRQQPFLDHVIRYYQQQGVERFIFSLGYLHEKIEHYLQEEQPGLSAFISLETEPLGTGGAIRKACALCTQPYSLVVNGDTLFRVNVQQIAQTCEETNPDCLLCVKPFTDFDRYGAVELNTDGTVRSFLEKKYFREGLINGGVYALASSRFLAEDLPEKFSFEKDYLEKYYPNRNIRGLIQEGYFIDIGIPDDLRRAQHEL